MRGYNRKPVVENYNGCNEYLNCIWDVDIDGPMYIVNGMYGRKPILADTAALAVERYFELYAP